MKERINQRTKNTLRIIFTILKGAAFVLLYAIFWNSNKKNEICRGAYRFLLLTVIYWALAAAILFWDRWMPALKKNMSRRVQKGLLALLWAAAPALLHLTTELACNTDWEKIAWNYAAYNYLIYLFCGVVLALIIGNVRIALTLAEITALIYGIASHYLLEFKNTPLRPSELMGAQTGLAVAGEYTYTLANGVVKAILLCMLTCIAIRFATGKRLRTEASKEKKGRRLAGRLVMIAGGIAVSCGVFMTVDISELAGGVEIRDWRAGLAYGEKGSALCFLVDFQNLRIEKPEGYTTEKAKEILASYSVEETEETEETEAWPNVIVIMNESFADLSVVGSFESEDYLTNYNSLTDYMQKGYAYVSIYGGGTCNSEFEFLTGSTMAFMGSGVHPYQTMQFDGAASMVEVFNSLGYQTLAMHPGLASNWNRERVYSRMEFDDFISLYDGYEDAVKWKGDCIDDESDYKELIRQLEAAEDPLFLFNVTIQNHGEYATSKIKREDIELAEVEEQYEDEDSLIAWLTGMKYSDEAFGELIEYLRDYDEPVILCFFGDHLPNVGSDFLGELEDANTDNDGKTELEISQNRYKVPYLIWSNYLEPEQTEMDLSLNYLGAWLLKYLGIQTSYSEYLLDLQETIQAVNRNGYMENDVWISLDEPDESLQNYEIVQYYRLFDS